jgi:AcrR family transcriptional regulator
MAQPGTRAQRAAERRQQILDAARTVAEAEGWAAVTSRRLAGAIGYTQPVLYSHFPGGKTEIMRTVALGGFAQLTAATASPTWPPASAADPLARSPDSSPQGWGTGEIYQGSEPRSDRD